MAEMPATVAAMLICTNGTHTCICAKDLSQEETWAAKIIAHSRMTCPLVVVLRAELRLILSVAA